MEFLANILIALVIVAGVSLLYFFQVGLWVMFIVLFVMFTIVNYIFIKILKLDAERILSNIE